MTAFGRSGNPGYLAAGAMDKITTRSLPVIVVVIAESKGRFADDADAKAAQRWVNAVNHLGQPGAWRYLLVTDPGKLGLALDDHTTAKWDEGQFELA